MNNSIIKILLIPFKARTSISKSAKALNKQYILIHFNSLDLAGINKQNMATKIDIVSSTATNVVNL